VVLAAVGYWSRDYIYSLRERGMTPIIAPDTTRSRPRKTSLGGAYEQEPGAATADTEAAQLQPRSACDGDLD
jgi:hypothetical protein